MSRLLLSGDLQHIQQEPPRVVIEVYDDDALVSQSSASGRLPQSFQAHFLLPVPALLPLPQGKAEYLGTTVVEPEVRLTSDPYTPPLLQYSPLHCGSQSGGDLLAAFELLQIGELGEQNLPALEEQEGGVYTVPANIRPVLSTYRLEVWLRWNRSPSDCGR